MSKKNTENVSALGVEVGADTHQQQLQKGLELEASGNFLEAAKIYYDIITEVPFHVPANILMAELCVKYGSINDAEQHWQRAVEGAPDNYYARVGSGICFYQLAKFKDALLQYEHALELLKSGKIGASKKEEANLYQHLAMTYGQLDRYDEMEAKLEKAIQLWPGFAQAHNAIGYLKSSTGDSDNAIKHYQLAIKADPEFGAAYRLLANEKNHTERDADVQAMEQLFEPGRVDPTVRMQVAFGLGKAYDDLGEYAKAFDYLKQGNDIHLELKPFDVDQEITAIGQLKEIYSPDAVADIRSFSSPVIPVFIVGMPRTGSSLVEQIIVTHSAAESIGEAMLLHNISREGVKDFPGGLKELGPIAWRRLGESYINHATQLVDGQQYIVDKLLGNYRFLGIIRMMLPQAKIIHCVRDPMDVCWSAYRNLFDDGLAQFTYDLTGMGKVYRNYEHVMQHWESEIPDWMLKVEYEALIENPDEQVRRILDYIGLPFEESCMKYYESKRSVKAVRMSEVHKPIFKTSAKNWLHYENHLDPFKQELSRD